MLRIALTDIKTFMRDLLSQSSFDRYALVEASVKMNFSYYIDGHINRDFYEAEETPSDIALWQEIRPHLFNIIRGRRLPLAMKIVLKVPTEICETLYAELPDSFPVQAVEGLYLNILYDQRSLILTTGISYRTFLPDKSLERLFDSYYEKHLERYIK